MIVRFHAGWSNFSDFTNDILKGGARKFTVRQSQRMFIEHFSRRLLLFHGKSDSFVCAAHCSTASLATAMRDCLGRDGGALPSSHTHGCSECTHKKRYRSDLELEGLHIDYTSTLPAARVAEVAAEDMEPPNNENTMVFAFISFLLPGPL